MANATFSASRRRNVKPTSSTLHVQTRDIDASGLTYAPEDGEFILIGGADSTLTGDGASFFHGAADANVVAPDAEGVQLRMVWGSAARSDRAVLAGKRTTVMMHGPGMDIDTCLFNADDATDLATSFPVGTLLSVGLAHNVLTNVAGDVTAKRLVLEAAGATGWVVGFVRETVSGTPGNGDAIKIHLYGTPRYHGSSD